MEGGVSMRKQALYKDGGISGALLKWLGIITMTIDHVGAGIIQYYNLDSAADLSEWYMISRMIGRLAFPIFVFLIVQGYQHTSNLKKYLVRLFIFAVISEVPFDLMGSNQLFSMGHQNIFFTLFIGVAGLAVLEHFEMKNQILPQIVALILSIFTAELLNTDYGWYGILFIFGVGILRDQKIGQTLFGVVMGTGQLLIASLAFLPIWFYNGERGRQNKWFFYFYYPAHLFVIYLIRQYLII